MTDVVAVYGTRPEWIKLKPVVDEILDQGADARTVWTGQSPDLVDEDSQIVPPEAWESLEKGISMTVRSLTPILRSLNRPLLVVGDTATALAGAQAGFLADIPVCHVEAGLRTYQREPHPEESFRQAIRAFSEVHLCPSKQAAANVKREDPGEDGIYVVGNPVIDALGGPEPLKLLVTLHRRENWGPRREEALEVLDEAAADPLMDIVLVRHPNWDLGEVENVEVVEPMGHAPFLRSLKDADLVLTDSGGLQEECAALGTPCLVWRTSTERVELAQTGAVRVLDPDNPEALKTTLATHLARRTAYGRGNAAERIVDALLTEFGKEEEDADDS